MPHLAHLRALGESRLVRFLIVGGFATLINYAVFYVLYRWTRSGDELASAVGFLTGVAVGYGLNKSWAFRHQESTSVTLVGKYLLVYFFSLALSQGLLYALVTLNSIDPLAANIVCIFLTTCTNYSGTRLVVFR